MCKLVLLYQSTIQTIEIVPAPDSLVWKVLILSTYISFLEFSSQNTCYFLKILIVFPIKFGISNLRPQLSTPIQGQD